MARIRNVNDDDENEDKQPLRRRKSNDDLYDADEPPQRESKAGGMPVWSWLLLGFGGVLILGCVLAVGLAIGKKQGEVARNEIGKGTEQPKSADPESEQLRKELATLKKELATLQKEATTLRGLLAKERDRALLHEGRAKGSTVDPGDSAPNKVSSLSSGAINSTIHKVGDVFSDYKSSPIKADQKYGNVFVVSMSYRPVSAIEERLEDGRYLVGDDVGWMVQARWTGYGVICTASQVKLLKSTGLKVKVKDVVVSPANARIVQGTFLILEAAE